MRLIKTKLSINKTLISLLLVLIFLISSCAFPFNKSENASPDLDDTGRKIIYIYSPNGRRFVDACFLGAYEGFNSENEEYCVKIINEEADIDITVDPDINPDIICSMHPNFIYSYAQKGYLEDLWPYIDKSENFNREDFNEAVKTLYESNGHLYGITNELCVLGIRLSNQGDSFDGSFTIEEFLKWLSENKDIRCSVGMDQKTAVFFCLPGLSTDYVDYEKGKASFDSERFVEFLEMAKSLSFFEESKEMIDAMDSKKADEVKNHSYLTSHTIGSAFIVAKEDAVLGKKMVFIGYPSDSEKPEGIITSAYNVAITHKGACREGAYEFIEYWLNEQKKELEAFEKNPNMHINGAFSSLNENFDKMIEAEIGEYVSSLGYGMDEDSTFEVKVTKEYIEEVKKMLFNARCETNEQREVKTILSEELSNFFDNKKDSYETAKIIQKRVQLFLEENR